MRAVARLKTRLLATRANKAIGQSGQAVVEYILVLVVTVGIILGVMYQFSDAFKKYVASYFGDYIACLLETGEMPSLGGESGADAGSCSAEFEPFTISKGRPLNGQGVGSRAGRSAGAKAGKSASAARSRRAGSSGFTSDYSAARNGERFRKGSRRKFSTTSGSSGVGSTQTGTNPYTSDKDGSRAQRMYRSGRFRLGGKFQVLDEKKPEKGGFVVQKKIKAKNGSFVSAKRLSFDPKKLVQKRATASTDLQLDLSVSDYIRYLIIFGIIAAIVVFFGGQFAQLRKSWQKD